MNGRITDEATPTKRMAALFRSILIHYSVPIPHVPDYADIEALIDPFVKREDSISRQDESTRMQSPLRREILQDDRAHAEARIEESVLVKMSGQK